MYKKKIPYSRQSISKLDIKEVVKTLKSDFLTSGPQVLKLEKEIWTLSVNSKCKFFLRNISK